MFSSVWRYSAQPHTERGSPSSHSALSICHHEPYLGTYGISGQLMDPLSVTASVAGILAAAAKVAGLIGQVKDAPESVKAILSEVTHIQVVIGALQSFVNRSRRVDTERAALIQVENVVTVLTQTVLVFSELETLVTSVSALASEGRLSRLRSRVTWSWQQSAAVRLVGQLQQHKTSLSLLLQIMQWSVRSPCEEAFIFDRCFAF
ncbi:hypothetical protein B0T14DRAFT_589145 [Immersiella caudata]|uniref:Fungal N-terminal domain-containing protein n=1 Tax=Immersiella caudata TaxID=314043 RepID=A0AA39WK39_9PEZI|nr:hypothetical protein B0T14DRAFT_589145 [Immersiella caudata]